MVNKKEHFRNQQKEVRASIEEVKATVEKLVESDKSSYGEELRQMLVMTDGEIYHYHMDYPVERITLEDGSTFTVQVMESGEVPRLFKVSSPRGDKFVIKGVPLKDLKPKEGAEEGRNNRRMIRSGIYEIECPRCKNLALHKSDSVTLLEKTCCPCCGYVETTTYQREAPDNFIPVEHHTNDALGFFCIILDGQPDCGSYRSIEERDIGIRIFADLERRYSTFDKERSFMTQWDAESKTIQNLVGDYKWMIKSREKGDLTRT